MVMLRKVFAPLERVCGRIDRWVGFAVLASLLLTAPVALTFAADASAVTAAMNSITAEEAQSVVNVLADDQREPDAADRADQDVLGQLEVGQVAADEHRQQHEDDEQHGRSDDLRPRPGRGLRGRLRQGVRHG